MPSPQNDLPSKDPKDEKEPEKKKYRKPGLVSYGSLGKLTLGGGTEPVFDGNSGMAMIKN
ncbi:MAG: hypothetical protein KIS92_21305 [Planctomycetota bacterium]|nr:hypothetical protein [Planctomycetota bacterium]